MPPGTAGVQTLVAVRRAHDLIDRCYAEPLDLDQIARAAGYSRYHFVRAFRAAYGETPYRYLTRRRIERAQDLLRSANLTVTEVCHLVGFSSLGSFSTLFTQLVGTSPSQFQRRARENGGPPVPGCYVLMWGAPTPQSPTRSPGGSVVATASRPASLSSSSDGSTSTSSSASPDRARMTVVAPRQGSGSGSKSATTEKPRAGTAE